MGGHREPLETTDEVLKGGGEFILFHFGVFDVRNGINRKAGAIRGRRRVDDVGVELMVLQKRFNEGELRERDGDIAVGISARCEGDAKEVRNWSIKRCFD